MNIQEATKTLENINERLKWLERQHETDAENIAKLLKKRQKKDWSNVEKNF